MLVEKNFEEGQNGEVTILLFDWHGEYTADLDHMAQYEKDSEGKFIPGTFVRCQVVWNEFALTQLHQKLNGSDDAAAENAIDFMRRELFAHTPWADESGGYIWEISGQLSGIRRAFHTLADALDTTVSGDDDAFDYWPNTMDMLRDLAEDLDSIEGTHFNGYRRTVEMMAWGVLERSSKNKDERDLLMSEWGNLERWKA